MENQQPKTGKFALNYGLLLGGISVVFAFILYTMDLHYQGGMPMLFIGLAIMLGVIIFGLSQFKKANGGFMTFGQGLKIGVGICLIGGIISMIFQLILANVIDPEMLNKQLEIAKVQMQERGMTPAQIEAQISTSRKFSTPVFQIALGLIFSIFSGFILSLIPALVMKKAPSEY